MKDTKLPSKEAYFSRLSNEHIKYGDYEHTQEVWKKFGCKTMAGYHDLYLKADVLILADVFQNFRKVCMRNYWLDSACYFTAPGLAWNAAFKERSITFDHLVDSDMLLIIENWIRGGILNDFKETISVWETSTLKGWGRKHFHPISGCFGTWEV